MTTATTRRFAMTAACMLAGLVGAPARAVPGTPGGTFDGYAAFYEALPNRLFEPGDARPMTAVGGDPDHPRATWSGEVPGLKGEHHIDLRETTPVVDGHSLFVRPESTFPGAFTVALGDRAKLYVNDRALCFEGQPPSGSGTADRYIQVTLVLLPFAEKTARRYELPRLFGSCLGITQADGRPVGFLAATLRQSPAGAPLGVDFASWSIGPDGNFVRGAAAVHATFTVPDDVFRFTVDPN